MFCSDHPYIQPDSLAPLDFVCMTGILSIDEVVAGVWGVLMLPAKLYELL